MEKFLLKTGISKPSTDSTYYWVYKSDVVKKNLFTNFDFQSYHLFIKKTEREKKDEW